MVEDLLIYISLDKFIYKYLFTHCSISTQTKMGSLQSICVNDYHVQQNQLPQQNKISHQQNQNTKQYHNNENKDKLRNINQNQKSQNIPRSMKISSIKSGLKAFEYFESLNLKQNLQRDIYRKFTDIEIHNKSQCDIELSEDGKFLNHKKIPITMSKFVQYNWRDVQWIDLTKCLIDDQEWRIFVSNANNFQNLKIIRLDENRISQVRQGDLQSFDNLRYISFGDYDKIANPLSKQSKQYLKRYSLKNPQPKFWIQYIAD